MSKMVKTFIAILIVIFFFIFFVKSCKNDFKESNKKKEEISKQKSSSTQSRCTYEYDTVYYSGNYGEIQYLPNGAWAAFLYATEPYCVINKDQHSECGNKNQDVSTKLGDTPSNTELRFKSQNNKNGRLIIRIRNK